MPFSIFQSQLPFPIKYIRAPTIGLLTHSIRFHIEKRMEQRVVLIYKIWSKRGVVAVYKIPHRKKNKSGVVTMAS